MSLAIQIIISAIIYWLPFYIFRNIYRKPMKSKILAFVIVCIYAFVVNSALLYIAYGYIPYGAGMPPVLWMALSYYYLIAKQPILALKPPAPEPPQDWKEY